MIRTSIVVTSILLLVSANGCDKSPNRLRQGVTAQNPTNDKSAGTDNEAAVQAKNVELQAGQKAAQAQMDFMKLRESYRQTITAGLVDLDRKVTILEGKGKYSVGKVKYDLETNLTQIRADRFAFTNDYKSLDTASSATWDVTKSRLDKKWVELVALVDKS